MTTTNTTIRCGCAGTVDGRGDFFVRERCDGTECDRENLNAAAEYRRTQGINVRGDFDFVAQRDAGAR